VDGDFFKGVHLKLRGAELVQSLRDLHWPP
jgi:hypothetical protein